MLFYEKSSNFAIGEGEDGPTQSLTYRVMNIDYKNLTIDLLELLDESWNQVANSCPDNPEEMTVEQIHAYTVAMCVITKMEEQITQYLKTGEKKIVPINFDKFGDIF